MVIADLIVIACLGALLALSGAAKLRAREETQDAFVSLRVPAWIPLRPAAAALPLFELVLGLGLVVAPAALLVAVAVVVTILLATYTLLIARALRFDEPVNCACFGRLGGHRVDRLTLVRNLVLVALGCWAIVIGGSGRSFLDAVGSADPGEWAAVAAALLALTAATLIAAGGEPTGPYGEGGLDYLRAPIPFGRLELPDRGPETLRGLASTQARLLIFLSPGCGSCERLAGLVDEWRSGLAPAVDVLTVYASGTTPLAHHDPGGVAFDPESNAASVLDIQGRPAGVLLGADGLLAGGPVFGRKAITALVHEVSEQIEPAGRTA